LPIADWRYCHCTVLMIPIDNLKSAIGNARTHRLPRR
jgi:hypothetical protein